MHLVISGYYGFQNTGDEAILQAMVYQLRRQEPGVRLTVLSNDPVTTCSNYEVEAVNRWDMAQILRVIRQADGLISGGGSLFQDVTSLNTLIYYTSIVSIAKFYNKPVFLYSQGVGPLERPLSRLMTRRTLKNVEGTVRDVESLDFLHRLGAKGPFSISPDPVLGSVFATPSCTWLEEKKLTSEIVTVSLRDWPVSKDYRQGLASALDRLAESGYTVLFISMHGVPDTEAAEDIAHLMKTEPLISPSHLSLEEKAALIESSALLIGMRLHSLILAANAFVPFAAISYDPKIDSFAKELKQPVLGDVNDEKETWDPAKMNASFEHLSDEDNYAEYCTTVRFLIKEAEKTPGLALRYFRKRLD
ncbi:polysaccharide pyruvyl transferase CsaB [Salimicrobium humidisoli]|uniref:Polysaccharide pyruvyl transferase CsaB n=1 Tax=Salimicrobium humidisoli TaxID=2029857 RepID=A0ABX4HT84_9BACI|nr:polysaccharide pyruvyl transferase CsaB [Salimicrobium humidisoli]PBB06441.1 polysaccharide pyruvyl transferase CsaB [Salimicrobium humidisoli]